MTFSSSAYRDVLVVCAHPDDESFGLGSLIATLVAAGARVRVLCFTRGEASTLDADASLPDRRVAELNDAADELGVDAVAVLDYPDGRLDTIAVDELADRIDAHVDTAELLLTFDEGGITGHPDHIAATAAAAAAGHRHDLPVLGWAIPDTVAAQLNAEYAAAFVGKPTGDLDLVVVVDRTAQYSAMDRHGSQLRDNPVPHRRLELQGNLEHLRFVHPHHTRPEMHADAGAVAAAIDHARTAWPAEICGLIGGHEHRLEHAVAVANIADPPAGQCGFHMDATGQFRATRAFEDEGLDITGVYHSHPHSAAVPSAQDIQLAIDPDITHLIIATGRQDPVSAAWRISDGVAEQVHIVTG